MEYFPHQSNTVRAMPFPGVASWATQQQAGTPPPPGGSRSGEPTSASVQPSSLIVLVSSLNVSHRFQALYFCLLLDPAKEQSGRFLCSRAGNSKRRGRQEGTLLWWESLLSFHRGELNSSGSYAGARALPLPGDVARGEHHLPARCWAWRAPRSKEQGSRLAHARSKCSSHSPRSSLREWGSSSWSLPFLCSDSQADAW